MKYLIVAVLVFFWTPAIAGQQQKRPVVSQNSIATIACGPCSLFNWLSHGNEDLQSVLKKLSDGKSPKETVEYIIKTYGSRQSLTKPSVSRYGTHNGGVGSVNLMIIAREILADFQKEPVSLQGKYLQQAENESPEEHLKRITSWFSQSIEQGVPVLFYIRCYRRSTTKSEPAQVFGHHVVITSIGKIAKSKSGIPRAEIQFVDPSGGKTEKGFLSVAQKEFTAPTFVYKLNKERAKTTKQVRTGKPLLEVRVLKYELGDLKDKKVVTAHFATFAEPGK